MPTPAAHPRQPADHPRGPAQRRPPVRVVVVDDHDGVRAALRMLLAPAEDIDLVGEARDGEEAAAVCRAERPDVVLMDLVMPGVDGVEAIRRIRAERPMTRVVVVTASDDASIAAARREGAVGCVFKHEPGDAVIAAVRYAAGRPPRAPAPPSEEADHLA